MKIGKRKINVVNGPIFDDENSFHFILLHFSSFYAAFSGSVQRFRQQIKKGRLKHLSRQHLIHFDSRILSNPAFNDIESGCHINKPA
ncbi:hypothetical protein BTO30_01675 [Domibacillus antri]|uniref:Uncharacterized protein n=1 Tax=Domibacillus antri TaxID=1714264 RepID=A0A1Q8Q9X0_9BACI|nr:hypothetical protein BTO30_01675 [Domibacillus antri]